MRQRACHQFLPAMLWNITPTCTVDFFFTTIAAKLIAKKVLYQNILGTINFVTTTKPSLYKANSFACSLANRDKPVETTLQIKCSGGTISVMTTKTITKIFVSANKGLAIPLGRGVCETKSKNGRSRPRKNLYF